MRKMIDVLRLRRRMRMRGWLWTNEWFKQVRRWGRGQ